MSIKKSKLNDQARFTLLVMVNVCNEAKLFVFRCSLSRMLPYEKLSCLYFVAVCHECNRTRS